MSNLVSATIAARGPRSALLVGAALAVGTQARGQEPGGVRLRPPDWAAPVEFTRIVAIRELSGGVLVADAAEHRLVFLPWQPGEATEIGRIGEGPGEFRGVGQLYALPGDSTLFVDSYSGRWNLLAGSRIVATLSELGVLNRLLDSMLAGVDARGRVLGRMRYPASRRSSGAERPDSLPLLIGSRASERVDTIGRLKALERRGLIRIPAPGGGPTMIIEHNPLASRDEALLFRDGWVAVARLEPYRVDWRGPSGQWRRGARLAGEPTPVKRREQCAAIARTFGEALPCEPSLLPGWPEWLPPFLPDFRVPVLFAAPGGSVVITRAPTADSSGPRYDVVDREGRLVRTIHLPQAERLIGSGEGSVYTVHTGALDLQTLRRHPWP